jgi:hypothetical protein
MERLLPPIPTDALVPARAKSVTRTFLLGGLLGAALGIAGFLVSQAIAGPVMKRTVDAMPSATWAVFGQLAGAWFLSTLGHEVGHLVGGMLQGFRFELLVVGPLEISRDPKTDRLTVGVNTQLELAGGVAACFPRVGERLIARLQWMVLGGPVASVLLALIGFMVWSVNPVAPWSAFALFTAVMALLMGIATMVPMQNGSFLSDGKRFLQLRRNDAQAHRDAAILLRSVRDRTGIPLADEPASSIAPMLEPVDGSMFELVARISAYAWLLERQAVPEAREHIERAAALTAGLPFNLEAAVALDLAFCRARFEGDADGARALMATHARAMPLLPATDRLRVEAAIAYAAGDAVAGVRLIAEARRLIAASPNARSGQSQWTLARLSELEASANP